MGGHICAGGCGFFQRLSKAEQSLNDAVSKSFIGKYFKLEARKSYFTREIRAGTATFLTMAYIITVNATILTASGGTCSISDCSPPAAADCTMKPNQGYESCLAKTKTDLVVATILSAMIGSIAMGVLGNLPFGLAPAMGPNAYLAYNLVGFHGSGPISYGTALAIIMLEGCTFLIISACGLRSRLARLIPKPVRLSCAAGIGLFIAFVGLQMNQGVGLIGPDKSTLVTLTACAETDPSTGNCISGKMQSPKFWMGFLGFIITGFGLMKNIKGSVMFGILFVTLLSWFRGTPITNFPYTPAAEINYKYFIKVVDFPTIKSTAGAISFTNFNTSQVWVAFATLLYVDVLATTGVLYTLAEISGFVVEDDDTVNNFEGGYLAYIVDAGSTIVGSGLGVATTATYVESSVGIREGGRTGLTAVVIGLCFFLSLFFTPLLSSVPPWAVGPSLVMVGVMMMKSVKDIDWGDMKEAMSAFVTMLVMPLSYSIANGIIGGIGVYVVLSLFDWVFGLVRRFNDMRKMVVTEQNQVSAAASTIEII